MTPSQPSDDGTAMKRKSKKGGARPGSGRKPGSKNIKRAPVSLKKLDEAGIDPLLEMINFFKIANNDAVKNRPGIEVRMIDGKATEVKTGNRADYRWAMEYCAKLLVAMMPYKYPKLAPVDRLGLAVPEVANLNLNITDARQNFVALLNSEVDRFVKAGATAGSNQPALTAT